MSSDDGSTPATGIYEPLSPPFQQLSDRNQGPLALLTATTLIILTSLTVCVKLQMMYAQIRKFRLDDFAMIAAIICGLGYTISICNSVQDGLGRVADDLNDARMAALSKNYYASNILFVLAVASAKASVLLLIIAIKPRRWVRLASWGVVAFVGVWGVASVMLLAFQCGPTRWVLGPTQDETCINQYAMQTAIRVMDIIIDLAIVVLPAFMMHKVQVSNEKRLTVVFLFGLRIVTPIFTAISAASLSTFYDASTQDRPFHAITPSIWTSATLNLSIVTACIPSIKRFLADWAAGLSNGHMSEAIELQESSNRSQSNTYMDESAIRSHNSKKFPSINRSQNGREKDIGTQSYHSRRGDTSESVEGLTEGIIMQTIDYTVEYDDNPSNDRGSASSGGQRQIYGARPA